MTKVLAMPPDVKRGSEEAHATMRACLGLAEATLGPVYEKRCRGEILQQMHDDAVRTGLDKALDLTPDDVVALEDAERAKKKAPNRGAREWQLERLDELITEIEQHGFKPVSRERVYAAFGVKP